MDDFQVGLSSSGATTFRDDFYESFQAPKYYDFINPQDPENIDEWFFRQRASIKEGFSEIIARSNKVAEISETVLSLAVKKPPKVPSKSFSGKKFIENENPNQGSEGDGKSESGHRVNLNLYSKVESPVEQGKKNTTVPATVPQPKILCSRKFAFEYKQFRETKTRATKALFESKQRGAEPAASARKPKDESRGKKPEINPETLELKYSEFRHSGDTPTCKRALVSASDHVVEQATMLESAMKLLKLGDDQEQSCTGIMRVVCSETAAQLEEKDYVSAPAPPVFAFRATRDDTAHQTQTLGRKRKSGDMYSTNKKIQSSSFIPPPSTVGNSKKLKLTCPQPFRLRTEERGALKEIVFSKKMEEYVAMKEGLQCFPSFALPKKAPQRPRKIIKVRRSQQEACANEPSIETLTAEKQQENTQSEEDKTKSIRKQGTTSHAIAMPSFDRPFKPQRSTKKLTIPVEPKFHTIHGSRTCTKHQPTTASC